MLEHYALNDLYPPHQDIYLDISKNNDASVEHSHDFYELIAVINGTGTHTINGVTFRVMPGDIFLINYGDKHFFTPDKDDDSFRWLNCIWTPAFITVTDPILLKTKKYNDKFTLSISNNLIEMLNEYNLKQSQHVEIIKYQLYALLLKLKRLAGEDNTISYSERHRKSLIKMAINYINEHYKEQINLNDIANHLTISQVYLCKLFKEEMKMGAIQYLRKVRVDKAILVLMTTEKTIQEISEEVGFSDVKSFFSAFKAQMGVTPALYKLHHKQVKK